MGSAEVISVQIVFHPSTDWLVWWSALLSLGIYSFLYRDNVLYKYIEHLFLGVSAGFWFTRTFWDVLYNKVWVTFRDYFTTKYVSSILPIGHLEISLPIVKGSHPIVLLSRITFFDLMVTVIATLFGLLILTRLVPKIAWISRIPLAFIVGLTASITIYTSIQSDILPQIGHTLLPLIEPNIGSMISSVILIIGVLTGLLYFYFSVEQKGALIPLTRLGIMFLMITFGASFGYSVMARVSLVVNTFQFLISDWLGLHIIF